MTVIKKRRGKLILSAAAGALGMGLVCGSAFFVFTQKTGISVMQMFQMEGKMEQVTLVRLSQDTSEGEILTGGKLESVMVQVPAGSLKEQEISAYEGKSLKLSLEQGCILSPAMLCSTQKAADDERLLNLSYVRLSEKMKVGDYIDIRISFRNGGDYVLLSKKKIQDIGGNSIEKETGKNALWVQVNEEEILRLASAVVDAYYQEGCDIYAIQYVSETQKAAFVTYPVNETVKELLEADPNVVTMAEGMIAENTRKELRSALGKE